MKLWHKFALLGVTIDLDERSLLQPEHFAKQHESK